MGAPLSNIEVLVQLGLTSNEAKVFLTLSELGTSTIKSISKASDVSREFVYKIIPTLQQKGLVEEIITSPKTFRSIPLDEAYEILLQGKVKENQELINKVTEMRKKRIEINPHEITEHYTIMAPPGKGAYNRMMQEDRSLKRCKDVIISSEHFFKVIDWTTENAELMGKRNIKVRMITDKNVQKTIKSHPEIFTPQVLSKLRFYDVGYVEVDLASVQAVIFDKQCLMIAASAVEDAEKACWLYSNHRGIVEMACSYFETLWNSSVKEKKDGWFESKMDKKRATLIAE